MPWCRYSTDGITVHLQRQPVYGLANRYLQQHTQCLAGHVKPQIYFGPATKCDTRIENNCIDLFGSSHTSVAAPALLRWVVRCGPSCIGDPSSIATTRRCRRVRVRCCREPAHAVDRDSRQLKWRLGAVPQQRSSAAAGGWDGVLGCGRRATSTCSAAPTVLYARAGSEKFSAPSPSAGYCA